MSTVALIRNAIRDALKPYVPDGLTGISCIAAGADSIFAEVVLDLEGELEIIIPASDYRESKVDPDHIAQFDEFIRRAMQVKVMPYVNSGREAYEAANEALVKSCDRLIAVWDGKAPVDRGGTAAVVDFARSQNIPVDVIWPEGATRS